MKIHRPSASNAWFAVSSFLSLLILVHHSSYAQAPKSFKYQSVARNSSGLPIASATIGLRVSVHDLTATGSVVYKETHTASTNAFGVFSVSVGAGAVVSGNFSTIAWGSGAKYIEIEADFAGGSSYTSMGTSQLLSVPYALYSENGTPGPAGPQGPIGLTGATGPAGSQGVAGTQGPVGATGPQGSIGLTGATGSSGVSLMWLGTLTTDPTSPSLNQAYYNSVDKKSYVYAGSAWNILSQDGADGATGLTGATGAQGIQGSDGPVGAKGDTGAQGPQGLQGAKGDDGAQGSAGISLSWLGTLTSNPVSPILNQAYYNSTDKKSYVYDGATWNILSQDGDVGAKGADGATGPQGPQGLTGLTGATGATGAVGATGVQGPAGPAGANGLNGTNGINGISLGWLGTLAANPASPALNQAYYNSTDKISYVYNGSTWNILAQDGTIGPQGPNGPMGATGATGAQGPAGLLTPGATAGNTPYWNGTSWIVSSSNFFNNGNGIGIGTTTPGNGLKLDIAGGGIRITDGSQAAGRVLTSMDNSGYASWATPNSGWGLTGTSGTMDGANFIGTTDNWPLNFKVNNLKAGRIATDNTFIGYQSGLSAFGAPPNFEGFDNTAFGSQSLFSNHYGSNGTAIGTRAMQYFSGSTTRPITNSNVAVGFEALRGSTNAAANTGNNNTALGYQSLWNNTTGNLNTANGMQALYSNNIGAFNTAIGALALYSNTNGGDNVAIGKQTLFSNTSGGENTAIGETALFYNTTGSDNTATGIGALQTNTNGNFNTALGRGADVSTGSLSNATAIGNQAMVNTSNAIQLGNGAVTQVFAGTGTTATLIAGGLKITGGTPAVGKVLTSDAAGVATWQAAISGGWGLTGTSGTTAGTNFMGTSDNQSFDIRTNNILRTRITTKGQIETYNTGLSVFVGEGAGANDDLTNNVNVFVGYRAGILNTTGSWNTANGSYALQANTTGNNNTTNGAYSLSFNTTGSSNTAYGVSALQSNTVGLSNTANGVNSLYSNTTGNSNIANGQVALYSNTSGNNNVATGVLALYSNVAGSNATAIGTNAMQYANNTSTPFTNYNVAVGFEALRGSTTASANTGISNTAIGYQSLLSNTSGNSNVANGTLTLRQNTTGSGNVAVGAESLFANSTGSNNTANGFLTLQQNTTGGSNTANGFLALQQNTSGTNNTANGANVLQSNVAGSNATAIGTNAMQYSNSTSTPFTNSNVAIGFEALRGSTSAAANTGNNNTALGYQSLWSNTVGFSNTASGNLALFSNLDGSNNTALGQKALELNTSGSDNTSVGNISLNSNTTGVNNTAIGNVALFSNTTGSNNTALGRNSFSSGSSFSNSTAIGYNAQVSASNMMVFGDGNVIRWGLGVSPNAGNAFQVGSTASNGNGAYLTSGGVWTNASDRNKKENFVSLKREEILSKIKQLPITRWNYKGEASTITHIGPMAQDFYKLFQTGSDNTSISTIDPAGVSLIAIQELIKQNEELKKIIDAQQLSIGKLEADNSVLKTDYANRLEKLERMLGVKAQK